MMTTSVSAVMAIRGKRLRIKAVRSALALMVAAAGGPPGHRGHHPRQLLGAHWALHPARLRRLPLKSIIREEIDRSERELIDGRGLRPSWLKARSRQRRSQTGGLSR